MNNAVTAASIEAKIAEVEYLNPASAPDMTLCILQLKNGFVVIGQSRPVDPANFDAALGRQLARTDAIRQIWPLEGYLLREQLAGAEG
ncbi:Gp49 family protein [Paracoccus denitrificans]|uniref:Gp49 family protein n=1 Tax=Paracoccus denitrificans TaxID=266 RepID=UPI00336509E7